MAKAAYLSDEDRRKIRDWLECWYYQDKKATAKELRNMVNVRLENREISLSYIQREMADIEPAANPGQNTCHCDSGRSGNWNDGGARADHRS